MPDISMCPSEKCPLRENCYRNEASGTKSGGDWQSWLILGEPGSPSEDERCRLFWAANSSGAALDRADPSNF